MICQTKRERKYEVLSICSSFSFLFYGDSTISCGKKQQENPSFDRNLQSKQRECLPCVRGGGKTKSFDGGVVKTASGQSLFLGDYGLPRLRLAMTLVG